MTYKSLSFNAFYTQFYKCTIFELNILAISIEKFQ